MKKYFLIALLFSLAACSKEGSLDELMLTIENNPIFGVQGTFDDGAFEMRAGVNDYFLFSNYQRDSTGVFFFYSKIEPAHCNQTEAQIVACPESFGLSISDVQPRPAGHRFSSGLPFLRAGSNLDFWQTELLPSWISLQIIRNSSPQQNIFVEDYQAFVDGRYHFSPDDNNTEVCMVVTEGNCQDTLCNDINLRSNCHPAFNVQQTALNSTTTLLQAQSTIDSSNAYDYSWDLQQLSGGQQSQHFSGAQGQVQINSPGRYELCLEIERNADNCTEEHCIHLSTPGYGCAAAYQYELQPILAPLNRPEEKVRLTWVDEQGLRYSSFLGPQANWSQFEILEVSPHFSNDAGINTIRVTARVDVRLYNAFGEYKDLRDAVVDLALAYPQ